MDWLHALAVASLSLAGLCSLVIALDLAGGHPQKMWIMNVVWPLTALYSGPLGLWAYYRVGRLSSRPAVERAKRRGEEPPGERKPFWQMVALAATHCGSGCTLGDLCAEWFVVAVPIVLFGHKIYGAWTIDFALAFAFGIAFQYFTIKPMRDVSPREGLIAALKADTLSLTAWQLGMYGWMGIATFAIFGHELEKTDPLFWLMMQVAMLCGLLTAYPVNWWLLRKGLKEKM